MRMLLAALATFAILGAPGFAGAPIIGAQTAPGWRGQFVATGTVKTASPTGREFTLWDGRTFVVPKPPAFVSDDLMPGAFVHAVYTTMDGQNIVTELTVHRPTPDFRDRR